MNAAGPPARAAFVVWLLRLACDVASFAVPAAVYAASASREPGSWDTAELQGVPYILGISHPTGFPLYVLLGYAWSHLAAFGSVAFRLNAMSGLAIAVAAAAAYAVARRLGARRWIALPATLWFAFVQDVWSHASRAEAQDLALACTALCVYAFVRWMQGGSARWFAASFALDGLGIAAHPNALWVAPALLLGALVAKRRPRARLLVASLALLGAGLLFYLYLPLRSAYVVAHGLDPTHVLASAGGGIFWNYNDPSTLPGLVRELTGSESGTPGYFLSSLNPLHVQDALWSFVRGFGEQYGAFALLLALAGLRAAWKSDWRTTLFACVACTSALLFVVTYTDEADIGRYQMLAWWLGVPLLCALSPRRRGDLAASAGRLALAGFLWIGAGLAFSAGTSSFSHPPNEGGRWVIDAVRPYVPRGAVIVSSWLDATSLAYGAYVDRTLPGRIVVSDDHLRVPLYRSWARTRRVFILINPNDTPTLYGTVLDKTLDSYHELLEVQPL